MNDHNKYAPVKIVAVMCGVGSNRVREDVRGGKLRHDGHVGEATGYNRRRGYYVHIGDAVSFYGSSELDEWTPRKPTPWGTEYEVAHDGVATTISAMSPTDAAGAYVARVEAPLPARVSVDGVEYVVADTGEELVAIEARHVDEAVAARGEGRAPGGMSTAKLSLVRQILPGMGYSSRDGDARYSAECGKAIREAIGKMGITIAEAARRLGRGYSVTSAWVCGQTTPYPPARQRIREVLGVDIDEICRGGGK